MAKDSFQSFVGAIDPDRPPLFLQRKRDGQPGRWPSAGHTFICVSRLVSVQALFKRKNPIQWGFICPAVWGLICAKI